MAQYRTLDVQHVNIALLRHRFSFLKRVNLLLQSLLPLIDLRVTRMHTLGGLIQSSREAIFSGVKREFMEKVLDYTATGLAPPKISVDRVSLQMKLRDKEPIDFVKDTNFGTAFEQVCVVYCLDILLYGGETPN